jgi:AraC family transcriptional regulator
MSKSFTKEKQVKIEKITSGVFYSSDFCELKNWTNDFLGDTEPNKGYNDCLCVVFVKTGWFLFDLSKESYNMHTGHIVIDKPDYEYRLRPSAGQCTIFNFSNDFYKQFVEDLNLKNSFFFGNQNLLSLLVKSNPEIDYLHHQIISKGSLAGKLEMDQLVLDMLQLVVSVISNESLEDDLNGSMRMNHLGTIEKAKQFIHEKFSTDISLYEIANYSCVSPFHFSRVFKKFTSYSPHQYLQNVRLKHGEILLRNSNLPVSDISFQSGFNTAEYFATAFKQKFKLNPSQYRFKHN